jgi:hypothetical protein
MTNPDGGSSPMGNVMQRTVPEGDEAIRKVVPDPNA